MIVDSEIKRTLRVMKHIKPVSPFRVSNVQIRYALNFSKLLEVFCNTEWNLVSVKKGGEASY